MIGGRILSASAISSWVNGSLYMASLVGVSKRNVIPLHVPTLALVEGLRGLSRERVAEAKRRLESPVFTDGVLDREVAEAVAELGARWEGDAMSPADAHVVWASVWYQGWPVVVSKGAKAWKSWLPDVPIEQVP